MGGRWHGGVQQWVSLDEGQDVIGEVSRRGEQGSHTYSCTGSWPGGWNPVLRHRCPGPIQTPLLLELALKPTLDIIQVEGTDRRARDAIGLGGEDPKESRAAIQVHRPS